MAATYLDKDMDAEMEAMEDSEDEEMSGEEDESGQDSELENKILELEQELEENPFKYSAHEQIVKLLKNTEHFEKLRAARNRFSEAYPLTGKLWLDWVADEQKIAASEEDKQYVSSLFEKGVKDYLSVDLWLEYCMFGMGALATGEGQTAAREIFEKSIMACGLHVSKGSLVWDAYREFELALLSMLPSEGTEEQVKAHTAQREKVAKLYSRQLRQPLRNMDSTFTEYKQWTGDKVDQNVVIDYHKAKEKLKKREEYENVLEKLEEREEDQSDLARESLNQYRTYLEMEKKESDPARIQCLYERAVAEHCLDSSLWQEYLSYLEDNLKMSTVSLPVYHRAIRNCPWAAEMWCDYLRALEKYDKPEKEVVTVFEQALAAGFSEPSSYLELWLTFIDYKRRGTDFQTEVNPSMEALRDVFERARLHLTEVGGDSEQEVAKYQANVEADLFSNMEVSRQIWAVILQSKTLCSTASLWLEFIQLEKIYGDKKHLRKAYQRALEKTFDHPELIAKSFLQFEREEGSLEAWEQCKKQCTARIARVQAQQAKQMEIHKEEEIRKMEKVEKKKEKDKEYRREKRRDLAATKREENPSATHSTVFKRPLPDTNNSRVAPPPGFKPPAQGDVSKKRSVEPPPGFKEPAAKKLKTVSDSEYEALSESQQREMRTVFLSNLSYEVDDEAIKEVMARSGIVSEVRLVKTPAGKSKGFAFVEFVNKQSAAEAISRDNEPLNGRPMYISECGQNKKEGSTFKFKTELEKNKLFVSKIDLSVTQDELREIFAPHGTLTGVRLVTYRNGHSKGIAFVEYQKEAEAAVALVKTDGIKVKGSAIQVALSNPPKKTEPEKKTTSETENVKSLGGTREEFGPRGKGRSQLTFTPRVLSTAAKGQAAVKLAPMKFVKPGGGGGGETTKKGGDGDQSAKESNESEKSKNGSKSNSDFRNMFLK